jgi:hypothetical protein
MFNSGFGLNPQAFQPAGLATFPDIPAAAANQAAIVAVVTALTNN